MITISRSSASSLSTYQLCPRRWQHTYIDKRVPTTDESSFAVNYGSAFHALVEEDLEQFEAFFGEKWQRIIRVHLTSLNSHWKASDSKFANIDYIAKEVPFSFTIDDGRHSFHGCIDGIAMVGNDKYIIESKTTGTADLNRFMQYKHNSNQSMLYSLAAMYGALPAVKGVLYDVSRRPSIKQRKTESDGEYINRVEDWYFATRPFHREVISYTTDELHEALLDFTQLHELQEMKLFPRNTSSCSAFNAPCEYRPVCFDNVSINSDVYKLRTRRSTTGKK